MNIPLSTSTPESRARVRGKNLLAQYIRNGLAKSPTKVPRSKNYIFLSFFPAARRLAAPTVGAVRHARPEPLLLRGPLQEPHRGHRVQDRRRRRAALAQGSQGEGGE